MNQQCKVCGEPAAGFHFGAFTCEGCKSFFGRSYNNLSSIADCKNGGECVINKKNRTACKACRLRKCLYVGMSKSGSRYGRRSNWFKIHCLLQEQQQQQQQQQQHHYPPSIPGQQLQLPQQQRKPASSPIGIHGSQRKDENHLLGLDDYKNSSSPSISSPESHNSDNSVEMSVERRAAFAGHLGFRPLHPHIQHSMAELSALSKEVMNLPLGFHLGGMPLLPHTFLPPPTMFPPYQIYTTPHGVHPLMAHQASTVLRHSPATIDENGGSMTVAATIATTTTTTTATTTASSVTTTPADDKTSCEDSSNNNSNNSKDQCVQNHNEQPARETASPATDHEEHYTKRYYLDAVLKSQQILTQRPLTPPNARFYDEHSCSPEPEIGCPPPQDNPIDLSMKSTATCVSDHSEEQVDNDSISDEDNLSLKTTPALMDLTTRS